MILDYLQATCWSVTYVFLIIYAKSNKTYGIPLLPLLLNYSWEIDAIIVTLTTNRTLVPLLMHGSWFLLDTVIVILYFCYSSSIKSNIIFIIKFALTLSLMTVIFKFGYALITSYVIDFIMSFAFLQFALFRNVKKSWVSYGIAIFKLAGDLFAWLNLYGVNWATFVVFGCNFTYLMILVFKKNDDAPFHWDFHRQNIM